MHIAGNRRILAPPRRVRSALTAPDSSASHLPHARESRTELDGRAADDRMTWQIAGCETRFQLAPGEEDSTHLVYDAEASGDDEAGLRLSIETFIDSLQSELAGPRETGAEGPLVAMAAGMQSGFPFRAMPNRIFGMPLIFWMGSAVFSLIFALMFGGYL